MSKYDLYTAINAISEVVNNRPPAIRAFDQIYMKFGDMIIQSELISKQFNDKEVVFIGDGDAIALCLMHLKNEKLFDSGPKRILVLDFDERVVNSINRFSEKHDMTDKISARLYNVANKIPEDIIGKFDAFYTNPPFGSGNAGNSLIYFMKRGIECCKETCIGCIIAADKIGWSKNILYNLQKAILGFGFYIFSMVPEIHTYHLEDNPKLTSCNLFIEKITNTGNKKSKDLDIHELENFYGHNKPLKDLYIRDLINGGKLTSNDFMIEPI